MTSQSDRSDTEEPARDGPKPPHARDQAVLTLPGSVDDFNEAHAVVDHRLLAVSIFYRRIIGLNV